MSKARNLSLLSTVEAGATTDQTKADLNAIGVNSGRKNLIINGAMQVSRRGVTTASVSTAGYHSIDRYRFTSGSAGSIGVYTLSQASESPDNFGSSYKFDVTTADGSPDAGDGVSLVQRFEGKNLQVIAKGTSTAKQLTVSFYVKTNKLGTYQVNFYDLDNSRLVGGTYVVGDTNWNRYTVTFSADTTGVFASDNGLSAQLEFWLAAGTNYTSGSVPTAWGVASNTNRAAGLTVNLSDNTTNEFHLTGVQLELGSTATDFEHRSYGEELALCQRYYWQGGLSNGRGVRYAYSTAGSNRSAGHVTFHSTMRTTPTMTIVTTPNYNNCSHNSFGYTTADGFSQAVTVQGTSMYRAYYGVYAADAEL